MSWTVLSEWFSTFQRLVMFFFTGQIDLQGVLSNRTYPFAYRVHELKTLVHFSRTKSLDSELEQAKVDREKSIVHDQLYIVLHKFELYQNLLRDIEEIRLTQVTATDAQHLDLFEKIWSRLVIQANEDDHEPMTMISKRWKKIGFQASNPLTDFRGMGLLGLQCIEYLSRNRTVCLSYVTIPPPNDYSFAIGMINIVSWLVHLLEQSPEKLSYPLLTHFSLHPCNLEEFFRLFALVVNEWHDYWIAKQANIMQFEELSKKFRAQLFQECQQWRAIRKGFATSIF